MTRATLLALVLAASGPAAAAPDLHAYWDGRCAGCHGHAGAFARSTLSETEGRLAGRHHREDLDRFLRNHYLPDDLIGPVSAMLLAQLRTPPLFSQKCGGCHGSAAEFVRTALEVRDGQLVGRRNGQPLAAFLARHGGLASSEVPVLVASLERVRRETGGS